jgi:ribosomal protein L16/L10AE
MKTENKEKKRSQYLGVSWDGRYNAWRARINVNTAALKLGTFQTELEAAKAFNAAAEKFGSRSRNILPE